MLDTDTVSDMIRHPMGHAAMRLRRCRTGLVCVSIVSACELVYGAARTGSIQLKARVDGTLKTLPVAPFQSPADQHYGKIRADLTAAGNIIGPLDLLIAAHARSLDAILVTHNVREFARVADLGIEDWVAEGKVS